MKILRKKKLIYGFLVFIIPFIVLSITVTGVVLSLANYEFFNKTIDQDYRNIIRSSAGEIRLFVENAQQNLDNLALLMAATKLDSWQKKISLTAFLHTNARFISVDIISANGEKIASSINDDREPVLINDPMFQSALTGKHAISGVIFIKDDLPVIHIAVPVFRLGEVHEILWAVLNLKSVWDILEGITIGKTGQIYIMDASGRYIAHRKIDQVIRPSSVLMPTTLDDIRRSDSPVEWHNDENGVNYYNIGTFVQSLNWIVILNQPVREIYAYLFDNFLWAVFITVVICLVSIILGWRWMKRLLVPIHTLHAQVQRVGEGDLDHKITIASQDEIGDLADAFNEMMGSLKEYIRREIESAKALTHAKNLAVLGTASSKVTHEVGNFLNNIDMALAGLKNENLSPRSRQILGILDNDSIRVKKFIQNFLQFSKTPELRLQKMPLDLIIKELLSIIQPEAEKRGIRIGLDWAPEIPMINMDASLMHQVFNNLIKNSMEAITDAGEIRISGGIETKSLVISITDTGPGMNQNTLNHLFEPFFTTKGKKGTGLGLSIVQSIIQSHRGTIRCQSTPGKGTTFIIHLPLN